MKAAGSLIIPGSSAAVAESRKQTEAKAPKEKATVATSTVNAAATSAASENETGLSDEAAVVGEEVDDWETGE